MPLKINEPAQILQHDQAGTLGAKDFICSTFYLCPRGADMFIMLAGTLHCMLMDTAEKPIGPSPS